MNFGSLFSGMGGLDLGLERAGMTCKWQAENNVYAQKVLEKHWPHVPRFNDVRLVTSDRADPVEIIAGGFPCQDISIAGKGKGLAGERSGLWREFHRIINEFRPPWVLIENVPALRTRGLRTVLGDLHASGYDAEWDGLPAVAFGAPHRRDRLFVVAYARSQSVRLEQRRGGRPHGTGALVFGCDGQPSSVARRRFINAWAVEPDVGRVAHGVPSRVDRLRGLGNAVVPQVAEHIGRLILEAQGSFGAASGQSDSVPSE